MIPEDIKKQIGDLAENASCGYETAKYYLEKGYSLASPSTAIKEGYQENIVLFMKWLSENNWRLEEDSLLGDIWYQETESGKSEVFNHAMLAEKYLKSSPVSEPSGELVGKEDEVIEEVAKSLYRLHNSTIDIKSEVGKRLLSGFRKDVKEIAKLYLLIKNKVSWKYFSHSWQG